VNWLFLFVSIVGAWFTFNVYRPHYRHTYFSVASFFAGWLTGELALLHIAWQVAATAAFWALGGLSGIPGVLGIGLTLASWVALVVHQVQVLRTADVVEHALTDALGEDYQQRIPEDLKATFETEVGWDPVLRPYRVKHPDVRVVRSIRYGREAGLNLLLDVYKPRTPKQDCPTLLQIHGGGWMVGSRKEQGVPLMTHLASRGWVCVSADYRLSPHATFPEHLIDLKRAIAWIRANAHEHGASNEFLAVTGGSAGGHLAAMIALTANDPQYQPGFEDVDTSVNCCVPFYGVYDFADRSGVWPNSGLAEILESYVMKGSIAEKPLEYEAASPLSIVNAEAPPFFVIHGDRDTLVPVAEARAFSNALRAVSEKPVAYAEVPGAQHAFEIFPSLRTKLVLLGAERFLYSVYADYLSCAGEAAEAGSDCRVASCRVASSRVASSRVARSKVA
jgi:acetyl esterase/lipase